MNVIKKDGTIEEYDSSKIVNAVNKSAKRVMVELTAKEHEIICENVLEIIDRRDVSDIPVSDMHNIV